MHIYEYECTLKIYHVRPSTVYARTYYCFTAICIFSDAVDCLSIGQPWEGARSTITKGTKGLQRSHRKSLIPRENDVFHKHVFLLWRISMYKRRIAILFYTFCNPHFRPSSMQYDTQRVLPYIAVYRIRWMGLLFTNRKSYVANISLSVTMTLRYLYMWDA